MDPSIMEIKDTYHSTQESNKALKKLMLELGVRQDNFHVGTGMGGNPSQWWFLVNHAVKAVPTSEPIASWDRVGTEEILLSVPSKPSTKQMREALNVFYENHPHRLEVTDKQIVDPAFLRDQPIRHIDAKVYIQAVETGLELQKWLDIKIDVKEKLVDMFGQETEVFRAGFLKDMKLPATYFEDHKDDEDDPMEDMFVKHPVWGVKDAASGKRYKTMFDQLLSQEDLDKIVFIGSCPAYVTLAAFRRTIGIERMVSLNLDEIKECDFLKVINKTVDQKEE